MPPKHSMDLTQELTPQEREAARHTYLVGAEYLLDQAHQQITYWQHAIDASLSAPDDILPAVAHYTVEEHRNKIARNMDAIARIEASIALVKDSWALEDRLRLMGADRVSQPQQA